jgi:hypothetical protein
MAEQLVDLYLYLAKRDKTGVRVLAIVKTQPRLATRLQDINSLNLPANWIPQIEQIIYDNRMMWEPWIETANSFSVLKQSLKNRGYTNLPLNGSPEFIAYNIQSPVINISAIPKKNTMVRRLP